MFNAKGKFAWYELMTSDTEAAGKFYADVVGWTTRPVGTLDGQTYTTFDLGSVGMAGMLAIPGHTSWIGYIAVDDVDAHIERIVEAGGALLRPAADVPGMLRFAVLADPQGLAFVVFIPNPAMGSPVRPQPPTVGTIGWHELYTSDLDAGFDFYRRLFGWSVVTDMDMGPAGIYRIFNEGDHPEMGNGGMILHEQGMPVTGWTFYFHVASIDAAVDRVKTGGGELLLGPIQVPGGSWILQAKDPQGAVFSLMSMQR